MECSAASTRLPVPTKFVSASVADEELHELLPSLERAYRQHAVAKLSFSNDVTLQRRQSDLLRSGPPPATAI